MNDTVYRAFSVNHSKLTIRHIGDYENKDDADMALHLDLSDDPAPDKEQFLSWHVVSIHRMIGRNVIIGRNVK